MRLITSFTGFHLAGICKNHHSLQTKLCSHSNSSAFEDSTAVLQLLSRCPYGRAEINFVSVMRISQGWGFILLAWAACIQFNGVVRNNSNWLISLAQLSVCKSGCSEYQPYTKGRAFLIQGLLDNMMMPPDFVFQRITHCGQSSVWVLLHFFETCYINKPALQNGYQILWSFSPQS